MVGGERFLDTLSTRLAALVIDTASSSASGMGTRAQGYLLLTKLTALKNGDAMLHAVYVTAIRKVTHTHVGNICIPVEQRMHRR